MEVAEKKRGNPNFGKPKNTQNKWDIKKRYQFKLCDSYESVKPRDKETNEIADNPYPPIFMWVNSGVAFNPERNEVENCRYIYGQASIWVKDQVSPEPTKQQIENPRNDIAFKNGSLFVNGNNTALLDFLTVQDYFKGNETPVENVKPIYFMVDEDKQFREMRNKADMAFLAEQTARSASLEDMVPVAMAYGIDVDNPEENEDRIRTEFIMRAKHDPEAFNRMMVDPRNTYRYNITEALRSNIISVSVIPGQMTLVDTGKAYFPVKEGADAADTFATLLIQKEDGALKLYSLLENMMSKPAQ